MAHTLAAETSAHAAQIEGVLDRAFGPGRYAKTSERVRERGARHELALSRVAVNEAGEVIGVCRIYAAHAYPRFLGHLLSRVPFSSLHAPDSREERFNSEVVGVLSDALLNVRREVGLFEEVERKYALPSFAGWKERSFPGFSTATARSTRPRTSTTCSSPRTA